MENPEWKQKAITFFPDLRDELEETDPDLIWYETPYELFRELRFGRLPEAMSAGNEEEISKIYAFAGWCNFHNEKDVWNAAGVTFYEHLLDDIETLAEIPQRLSPEVFVSISGLLEWHLDFIGKKDAFATLQADFARYHHIPPDDFERRIHRPVPPTNDTIPAINGAYEI